MFFYCEDAPLFCQTWMTALQRSPHEREQRLQELTHALNGADPLMRAWIGYTYGCAHAYHEHIDAAEMALETAQQAFEALDLSIAVLHCRRALLYLATLKGAGRAIQADFAALVRAYIDAQRPLDAARTQCLQLEHVVFLRELTDTQRLIESARWLEQYGSTTDQAWLAYTLADVESFQGSYKQAYEQIDLAYTRFSELMQPIDRARCQFRRATIQLRSGAFTKAYDELEAVLHTLQPYGLALHTALTYRNMGAACLRMSDYRRAMQHTWQAHRAFETLGRIDGMADCALHLGAIAYQVGRYELALMYYRRAQAGYERIESGRLARMACRGQVMVQVHLNDLATAQALLATLQPAATGIEVAELDSIQAGIAYQQGNYAEARTLLPRAIAIFAANEQPVAAGQCWLDLGLIELADLHIHHALAALSQAQAALHEQPHHQWRIAYGLARCAELQADPNALAYYQQASAIIANLRTDIANAYASSGIALQAQELYAHALRYAWQQGDLPAALSLMEQQRALTLSLQIAGDRIPLPADLQERLEQQQAAFQQSVYPATETATIDPALIEYMDTWMHISSLQWQGELSPFDLAAVREHLDQVYPAGWLVLCYAALADDQLLLLQLDAHSISGDLLHLDHATQRLIHDVAQPIHLEYICCDRSRLYDPSQRPWHELASLAECVLPRSLWQRLRPAQRLLIIPTGPLHAIPWAALRLGETWLCERAVLQFVPSLAAWWLMSQRQPAGDGALLIGCHDVGDQSPRLPEVHAELDNVMHWCRNYVITRLEDAQPEGAATRQHVLDLQHTGALQRYRLIHIASHAYMLSQSGMLAHIKLVDGNLWLNDIATLTLDHALVVLAVCHGAESDVLPGEELLSLGHAFLAAGARDVIAHVGLLAGSPSQQLLDWLYQALNDGRDVPSALAFAQRNSIAAFQGHGGEFQIERSPFIWCGLLVMGAGVVGGL
ncbi:MAG: CHAT domain-containing protein [Chloroflexaceae bacterium]|nr:CHAT domain-containing protein [Chloroflexaceae bacterium]